MRQHDELAAAKAGEGLAIVEQHDGLVLVGKMRGCLSASTISA
jgi:hypothetical protein